MHPEKSASIPWQGAKSVLTIAYAKGEPRTEY